MQESFRSLLDEALIVAIANDHNLQQTSEYEAANAILTGLAQEVTFEEATGFNPSGIPVSPEDVGALNDQLSTTTTTISQHASQSCVTDSSGTDLSSSAADATSSTIPRLTSFNNDTEESKVDQLKTMFAELKEYDIKYSLKKANGDFQVALDDLLNVQYLKSTGQEKKGVEGFFQPETVVTKKGRKKGKRPMTPETESLSGLVDSPGPSKTIQRNPCPQS